MVNVTPYDNLDDIDCRWQIEGYGLVFGKDLDKNLKDYYREQDETKTSTGKD